MRDSEDTNGRSSYKERLLKPGVDQGVDEVSWWAFSNWYQMTCAEILKSS